MMTAATIAAIGANAVLSWGAVTTNIYGGAVTVTSYQTFGSAQPYFKPGDWSSPAPLFDPTPGDLTFTDTGALTAPGGRFYVVKAISAAGQASANSNRVGKFTYQLTPGQ